MRDSNFYYFRRFVKWKLGDKSPIVASLKITQRCNLRCTHCSWKNKITEELPTKRWKEVIQDVWDRGCKVVVFEGGEPTLRADLQELIEYSSSLGLKSIVVTNGTQDLTKITPNRIWISVEGEKDVHDRIRGKGTFEKIMQTIEKNRNKNIITLTTISKTNVNDIEKICETFSGRVQGFIFNFLYPYKDIEEVALTNGEKRETAERLLELRKKYRILNSVSYLKAVGTRWKCYPQLLISATADGKFSESCMVGHLESCNCQLCDMSCYAELAHAMNLKLNGWKSFSYAAGLP